MSNIKKCVYKMCSARRRGRSAAAPPAEMQRRSRHRLGRSNQSGPADMLTVSMKKHAEALQTFNPHPHHSNLRDIQTSWNIPEYMTWSSMGNCKILETHPHSFQGFSSRRRLPAANSAKTIEIVSTERHWEKNLEICIVYRDENCLGLLIKTADL